MERWTTVLLCCTACSALACVTHSHEDLLTTVLLCCTARSALACVTLSHEDLLTTVLLCCAACSALACVTHSHEDLLTYVPAIAELHNASNLSKVLVPLYYYLSYLSTEVALSETTKGRLTGQSLQVQHHFILQQSTRV